MRNFKIMMAVGLGMVLSAGVVWGKAVMPEKCPSVSAIQGTPFSFADTNNQTDYYAGQVGTYDTKDTWAFVVMNIDAVSSKDAMEKARLALPTLTGNPKPKYKTAQDIYICTYSIGSDYFAAAFSPLHTNNASNMIKMLR